MKKIVLALALLVGTVTLAQNKNAKATIEVDGVCNMCKERIEKTAKSVDGVIGAVWVLEDQELHLDFDPNKTSADEVAKAIALVGHDTEKFKAEDSVYNALPACCFYRD